MYGGARGLSDFHTFQYRPDSNDRKYFLITQCKSPVSQTWGSTWLEGAEQLGGLSECSARHSASSRKKLGLRYSGSGLAGQIFKYNDVHQDIDPWQPRKNWQPPTGNQRDWYHIQDEAHLVQAALDHIHQFH
jgi:hypothetical protein